MVQVMSLRFALVEESMVRMVFLRFALVECDFVVSRLSRYQKKNLKLSKFSLVRAISNRGSMFCSIALSLCASCRDV
jgi:hypothetical protein